MEGQKQAHGVSRREFLKVGLAGTMLLFVRIDGNGAREALAAPIPGGTLDPLLIPKYLMPLVNPPAMPMTGTLSGKGMRGKIDYYEIAVRQLQQRILPPGLPLTTVWGYCSLINPKRTFNNAGNIAQANVNAAGVPGTLNYPSFTIEATAGRPVRVKWINQLRTNPDNPRSKYLPHLLTVDPTIHWANPAAGSEPAKYGTGPIDATPEYAIPGGGSYIPQPYTGPVPFVTHVHGALNVGDESDGYTEAWYLPQAGNIPTGYYTEGSWYKTFRQKYYDTFGETWEPGSSTFHYTNSQRATTLWYHDHVLGMTRLNVYAGPAGFYFIRGGAGDVVTDARSGKKGVLPSGAYEIPIVVQDRSFDNDGQLFFPNGRAFFDGYNGPFIPASDMHPFHNPEFFGNTMVVNGRSWPKVQVEPRRYRIRFLNGCNSRFLALKLVNKAVFDALPLDNLQAETMQAQASAVPIWQIGNEGGFLRQPVDINNLPGFNQGTLLMSLAERADVIIDFSGLPAGTQLYLTNEGPDEPFGGGVPGVDYPISDRDTTRQVLLFEVVPLTSADTTTPANFLRLPALETLPPPTVTRAVALIEEDSATTLIEDPDNPGQLVSAGPRAAFCGTVENNVAIMKKWTDPISENPQQGAVEDWDIYNFTMDAHPIHLHEVPFEVIERRAFSMDPDTMTVTGVSDVAIPPEPWENGLKDTVIAYPDQITRVRARFDNAGRYVWHCHIVDHEDNEMMRPYDIGPLNDRSQLHTGRIKIDHLHNEAIITYTYVGDALVTQERIKPASGRDAIVGKKLTIDAIHLTTGAAVTEVGGGEGYGVNTPPSAANRKTIEGNEQLAIFLNKPAADGRGTEKTYMLDIACAFRLTALGGSASVIVEAFKDGSSVAGPQTLNVAATAGSLFTPGYQIAFGAPGAKLPFDRIVFSAGPGSTYSIVRPIEIRTLTASFNANGTLALNQMSDSGAQARQIFVCDI